MGLILWLFRAFGFFKTLSTYGRHQLLLLLALLGFISNWPGMSGTGWLSQSFTTESWIEKY